MDGTEIGDFKILTSKVGHIAKEQFEHYEFPMTIILMPIDPNNKKIDLEKLEKDLHRHVERDRLVHSSYGSPFDCSFGDFKLSSTTDKKTNQTQVILKGTGIAIRNREILTQSQENIQNEESITPTDEFLKT